MSWINEKSSESKTKCYCRIVLFQPFQDGGRYHIETSPLIHRANQWTGFYMKMVSVMKGLIREIEKKVNVLYSMYGVEEINGILGLWN